MLLRNVLVFNITILAIFLFESNYFVKVNGENSDECQIIKKICTIKTSVETTATIEETSAAIEKTTTKTKGTNLEDKSQTPTFTSYNCEISYSTSSTDSDGTTTVDSDSTSSTDSDSTSSTDSDSTSSTDSDSTSSTDSDSTITFDSGSITSSDSENTMNEIELNPIGWRIIQFKCKSSMKNTTNEFKFNISLEYSNNFLNEQILANILTNQSESAYDIIPIYINSDPITITATCCIDSNIISTPDVGTTVEETTSTSTTTSISTTISAYTTISTSTTTSNTTTSTNTTTSITTQYPTTQTTNNAFLGNFLKRK